MNTEKYGYRVVPVPTDYLVGYTAHSVNRHQYFRLSDQVVAHGRPDGTPANLHNYPADIDVLIG